MRARSVLLLAALALAACKRGDDPPSSAAAKEALKPVHVQTAPVAEQPMPEYLTLTGTLRASEESDIAADASGKVLKTNAERGQHVKKGEILITLDARSAALSATAAQAQANLAKTQLDQAQKDCARDKHLFDTGAISQAEFDRATTLCSSQQWSAAAAEAQVQTASKLVGDSRIRAPFDGTIGERFVNVGQYVSPATRVASLYEPDPLRLELTVPEADIGALQQDMAVSFTVAAFGDEAFTGTVKFISPNVRAASRDLVIEATVPNADGKLRPGMFAVARLRLADKTMPVVPKTALRMEDGKAHVFVVVERLVVERIVQTGSESGDKIGIINGVKPGDMVVTAPGADLRDGAPVE